MHTVDKLSYDHLSCTLFALILGSSVQHLNMLCSYLMTWKNDEIIHDFELFINSNGYAKKFNLNKYACY